MKFYSANNMDYYFIITCYSITDIALGPASPIAIAIVTAARRRAQRRAVLDMVMTRVQIFYRNRTYVLLGP